MDGDIQLHREAFANRRTCIEPEHVSIILKDGEYATVETAAAVMPGDLMVYETAPGDISHVAVVVFNDPNLQDGTLRIGVLIGWGIPA